MRLIIFLVRHVFNIEFRIPSPDWFISGVSQCSLSPLKNGNCSGFEKNSFLGQMFFILGNIPTLLILVAFYDINSNTRRRCHPSLVYISCKSASQLLPPWPEQSLFILHADMIIFAECKVRRKAVATKLNQLMDRNDAVLEKMNQWIKDKLA